MNPATVYKICSRCNESKSLDSFQKRKGTKDGLTVSCKSCRSEICKRSRKVNSDNIRLYNKQYSKDNRPALREKVRKWREVNKFKWETYCKAYNERYRGRRNACTASYRARKLQATPKWANIGKIKEIYSNCPEGYEVDHIVPLQGELVCGLHVENNLQYLPIAINRSKSNKFEISTLTKE